MPIKNKKDLKNRFFRFRSIRLEILVAFLVLLFSIFYITIMINTHFLDDYYLYRKKEVLLDAYKYLNNTANETDLDSDEFKDEMRRLNGTYGVSSIVIDSDSKLVQSSGTDAQMMLNILLDHVFSLKDSNNNIIIYKSDKYQMERNEAILNGLSFIELWGTLDNGNLFMIRSAIEETQLSAQIANIFFMYVSIICTFLAVIYSFIFSKKITTPIKDLTEIAKKMAHLDFEYRYDGDAKNEIGVLGEQLNDLSSKLESTISELKTANIELQNDIEKKEELDQIRKDFLSGVSHELKTPLAIIMGYAEGLKDDVNTDSESRDYYLDVIIDESKKMNEMVKKLLTLNELEFGTENLVMERFDLIEMISTYLMSASVLAKDSDIDVQFNKPETCYVWADPFYVEEVFTNYYSNAVHFVDDKKTIRINVEEMEDKVRVNVYNSGKQIPEESLPHLFEKFYKVDKARTRDYGGSGIGLSIVKVIMDNMKQDFGVRNLEDGVEFWFELPTK